MISTYARVGLGADVTVRGTIVRIAEDQSYLQLKCATSDELYDFGASEIIHMSVMQPILPCTPGERFYAHVEKFTPGGVGRVYDGYLFVVTGSGNDSFPNYITMHGDLITHEQIAIRAVMIIQQDAPDDI